MSLRARSSLARGAGVPRQRRRGVGQQHVRVVASSARACRRSPPQWAVEVVLHAVGERPVGGGVPRARVGAACAAANGARGTSRLASRAPEPSMKPRRVAYWAGGVGPAAGVRQGATGWGRPAWGALLVVFRDAGAVLAGRMSAPLRRRRCLTSIDGAPDGHVAHFLAASRISAHGRSFEVGGDQAQEGDRRLAPRQALHQARARDHRRREGGRRRHRRQRRSRPGRPEGQGRLDAQGQHRARDRQGHRRGRGHGVLSRPSCTRATAPAAWRCWSRR